MIVMAADWRFRVDPERNREKTLQYSLDHCTCPYCMNYYDTLQDRYPGIQRFLQDFGVRMEGPVEVMPFEPTLFLACYRVQGKILQWGHTPLFVDGISITPEAVDEETFHLWIGEMELPWVQGIAEDEVVSPANLPEFLERMQQMWQLRHGTEFVFS